MASENLLVAPIGYLFFKGKLIVPVLLKSLQNISRVLDFQGSEILFSLFEILSLQKPIPNRETMKLSAYAPIAIASLATMAHTLVFKELLRVNCNFVMILIVHLVYYCVLQAKSNLYSSG